MTELIELAELGGLVASSLLGGIVALVLACVLVSQFQQPGGHRQTGRADSPDRPGVNIVIHTVNCCGPADCRYCCDGLDDWPGSDPWTDERERYRWN